MEVQTCGKPIDLLLEKVLCINILSSDYFKDLYRLKTHNEVIDEIFNQVDHVEPWMTGNCRGPSTAFCLLYKFFTMKLTVKQMQGLLNHPDSPYIRAVGFLYLRYVGDPKTLWSWFEPYVEDDEEFSPGTNGRMTTMGVYIRDLILDQYYFDTLFPRIPIPLLRQMTSQLERMKLPTQAAGVTGTGRHASDDTARRPPSVKAALSVSFGQRAPHRASTRDSSPVRRTLPPPPRDHHQPPQIDVAAAADLDHRRDNNRSDRRGGRDRDYDRRDVKEDDRHNSRREREDNYHRHRDRDRRHHRSRSRSPNRRHHHHHHRSSSPTKNNNNSSSGNNNNNNSSNSAVNAELLKLRDRYGDASGKDNSNSSNSNLRVKDSSGEDVIRLGGPTWR